MNPKLSVVVPVGGGRLGNLRNCLYSLTLQTMQNFEIIVVNDGAEDEVLKVLGVYPDFDMRYIKTPKFVPNEDIPPRNKGARLARAEHLVFIDSDVILDSQALAFYVEDYEQNPYGVVAGLYDWMPPARISLNMIEAGLDNLYDLVPVTLPDSTLDVEIKLKIQQSEWPKGVPTHNVSRDMRRPMFMATDQNTVYTGPGNMNVYLGMFSGNLGFSRKGFFQSGGYWADLTAGLVDDGALGLTFWALSVKRWPDGVWDGGSETNPEFSVRLDKRIRGAHQYHDRDVNWVQVQSSREVEIIDRRFRLGKYADGRAPIIPAPLHDLTALVQENWGTDHWRREF